jgi:hypothetical protein
MINEKWNLYNEKWNLYIDGSSDDYIRIILTPDNDINDFLNDSGADKIIRFTQPRNSNKKEEDE